ncbi:hypothetical protein FACS189455_3770 [Bacteroidia bacterium]|nr:hypothetical protein FACS189455_3770 [Bacteroidia bacterium]
MERWEFVSIILSRKIGNKEYCHFAETLLDEIFIFINTHTPINFDNGLAGIAWGIDYLIKNRYVNGNINSILKDIDNKVYRTVQFEWMGKEEKKQLPFSFIKILFYLKERLKVQKKGSFNEFFFKNQIIQIINKIENMEEFENWHSSFNFRIGYPLFAYLYVLAELLPMQFYNYKIHKIFDEKSSDVLSLYPQMNVLRLYLLLIMKKILRLVSIPYWEEHCHLLETNINYEIILKEEFKNKQIFLNTGIAGYVFLLSELDNLTGSRELAKQKKDIVEKIACSECWNIWNVYLSDLFIPELDLLDGFPGVGLAYYLFLSD